MSSTSMFPSSAFAPRENHFQPWFARHLRILEEAPLHTGVDQLTIRFLWLRTAEPPLVIRIAGSDLQAKVSRGLKLGGIVYRELRQLTSTDIDARFRALEFWYRPDPPTERRQPDGAHWLLEAATPERYRAMRAHAPPTSSAMRRFCLDLLHRTGIELPPSRPQRTGRRVFVCR